MRGRKCDNENDLALKKDFFSRFGLGRIYVESLFCCAEFKSFTFSCNQNSSLASNTCCRILVVVKSSVRNFVDCFDNVTEPNYDGKSNEDVFPVFATQFTFFHTQDLNKAKDLLKLILF